MAHKLFAKRSVERTVLPNGITVMTERMPQARSVSLGIWLKAGSRWEKPEEGGISHFIEHMVFKGTQNRDAEAIASSLDLLGGHMDAFTSREMVSFNAKVMEDHLPIAYDVLSDLLLRPLFRQEDVAKEQGVVLEEIKMDQDSPEYQTHELFCRNFWKNNALGRPILGTPESVKRFDSTSIRKYFQKSYQPPNLLVTMAGQIRHSQAVRLVEKSFGLLPPGKRLPRPAAPKTYAEIAVVNKPSLKQVQLCLGAPMPPVTSKWRFTSYLLNNILGGGMSSRLFQNLRERNGLVYSVASELSLYRDTGCMGIYAGTSAKSLPRLLQLTMEEFQKLKHDKVSEEELRRSKENLKGSIVLGLESSSSRMSNLARQEIFFGEPQDLDQILDQIESVTREQVRELAGKTLLAKLLGLTVLGRTEGQQFTRQHLSC